MKTQNTVKQNGISSKEKLQVNIQQVRMLSAALNKLYVESMLEKLTHIYIK